MNVLFVNMYKTLLLFVLLICIPYLLNKNKNKQNQAPTKLSASQVGTHEIYVRNQYYLN